VDDVFAVYDMLFNVSFVSAALFAALTLPSSGRSPAVVILAAGLYAGSALIYAKTSLGPARSSSFTADPSA